MHLINWVRVTDSGYKMRDWEKAFLAVCIFVSIIGFLIFWGIPWLLSSLPNYDLEITVLGTDIEEEYTEDGWEHIFIIEVKIENTGNEELTVSYGNFHILTKDRRALSSTWTEGTIFLEKLPAGTWVSGNIAFKYKLSEVAREDLDKLVFEKEIFGDDIHFEWNISDLS